MDELPRRRCRGRTCRQHIILAPTQTGRYLPIDAEPDEAGNVQLAADLLGYPYAQVLNDGDATRARDRGETLYMPHHASCVDVDDFR